MTQKEFLSGDELASPTGVDQLFYGRPSRAYTNSGHRGATNMPPPRSAGTRPRLESAICFLSDRFEILAGQNGMAHLPQGIFTARRAPAYFSAFCPQIQHGCARSRACAASLTQEWIDSPCSA